MEKEPLITEPVVAWGVASRALPGQNVCGDLHLVKPFTGGVLLAAVDGIGHGEEADVAAKAAVAVLERDAGEPLEAVVRRCHESLLKTRGVVMTLGALDPCQGQLKWF